MDVGFWTAGPVPPRLLSDCALPRPHARAQVLSELDEQGVARIGGAAGIGRSTLANQIAQAWPNPTLFIDGPSMLNDSPHLWAREILKTIGQRQPPNEATWQDVAQRVPAKNPPLLVLDEPPDAEWVDEMMLELPTRFVVVGQTGVTPDDIAADHAAAFLRRRTSKLGVAWHDDAIEEMLRLARGRPDLLQLFGQHALHRALRDRLTEVTEQTVVEAEVDVAQDLPSRYAGELLRASPAKAALLKAVARAPMASPTEWGAQAGLDARSVPVHLSRLVQDGLLEKQGRGDYRIANPLIGLHLQLRHGSPMYLHRRAR